VDKPFDALFQLYKCAVVGDADDASFYMRADRITFRGVELAVGCELLEAQRYPLLLLVELQDFNVDLVANVHQVAVTGHAAP